MDVLLPSQAAAMLDDVPLCLILAPNVPGAEACNCTDRIASFSAVVDLVTVEQ
jgi:hypothetical protein